MSELAIEPELYSPNVDENGKYVDHIPSVRHGLRCPCSSRRDHIYANYSAFSSHIKTKTHKKWLEELNHNRGNFYVENMKLTETVKTQRILIAKLEKELNNRNLTIDYLTSLLAKKEETNTVDLLEL